MVEVWIKRCVRSREDKFVVQINEGANINTLKLAISDYRKDLSIANPTVITIYEDDICTINIEPDVIVKDKQLQIYYFDFPIVNTNVQEDTKAILDSFERGFALGVRATHSSNHSDMDKTPPSYVLSTRTRLDKDCVRFGPGVGRSFLTVPEAADAAKSLIGSNNETLHEQHLVAYMTPILRERLLGAFPNHTRLVNSERYIWLEQSSGIKDHQLAPDHILAPHYLIDYRHPYRNAPKPNQVVDYGSFGTMHAKSSLYAIGDAKKIANASGQADLMKYLRLLTKDSSRRLTQRGFVYDASTCILMTAVNGEICQLTEVPWTAAGSLAKIRDYFTCQEDIWDRALVAACNRLNVSVPNYSTVDLGQSERYCCILGCGAYGRVFRVIANENTSEYALKIVLGKENTNGLKNEYEVISCIRDRVPHAIADVVPNSFVSEQFHGEETDVKCVGAILIPIIGKSWEFPEEVNPAMARSMLQVLSDIHCLGKVTHGDARFRNVVFFDDSYRWVDFRGSGLMTTTLVEADIYAFFKSIKHLSVVSVSDVTNYAEKTIQNLWESNEDRHFAVKNLVPDTWET